MRAIASNGYINIVDIKFDINDSIKTDANNRYKRLRYDRQGNPYFIQYGVKYQLSEFFKF